MTARAEATAVVSVVDEVAQQAGSAQHCTAQVGPQTDQEVRGACAVTVSVKQHSGLQRKPHRQSSDASSIATVKRGCMYVQLQIEWTTNQSTVLLDEH